MLRINIDRIPGIAAGFNSKSETWLAIYAAFTGGVQQKKSYMLTAYLNIPEWGQRILDYMFGIRDSASEADAVQALDQALALEDLNQLSGSANDYQVFLRRLKLDELDRKYGYYLRGGVDIQSLAEVLPENLSIGARVSGLGSTILGQSILGNVAPLTAEAVGTGEPTSLNDNEKTEDTSMYPLSDWLSDNALYVGIAAIVILGVIYYKWVR